MKTILIILMPFLMVLHTANVAWADKSRKANETIAMTNKYSDKIELEAAILDKKLIVSLINISNNPIIIDKYLVLLIHLEFYDKSGKLISMERKPALSEQQFAYPLERRFISLPASEKLSRTIDFGKEILIQSTAISIPDHDIHTLEEVFIVPAYADVGKIRISYGTWPADLSGINVSLFQNGKKIPEIFSEQQTIELNTDQ